MPKKPTQAYVTLTRERYAELIHDEAFLEQLQNAGVDNWPGYDNIDRDVINHAEEQALKYGLAAL